MTISDEDFNSLRNVSDLNIPRRFKKKFEENIDFYMDFVEAGANRPDKSVVLKYLYSLNKRLHELSDIIKKSELYKRSKEATSFSAECQALWMVFDYMDLDTPIERDALIDQLNAMSNASDRVIAEIKADHPGSPGRNPPDLLYQFFDLMGKLFEQSGGTATAYWSEHDRGDEEGAHEGSAFVDFMQAVFEFMPPEYRPAKTKRALAAHIRRWREDRLAAQKRIKV